MFLGLSFQFVGLVECLFCGDILIEVMPTSKFSSG